MPLAHEKVETFPWVGRAPRDPPMSGVWVAGLAKLDPPYIYTPSPFPLPAASRFAAISDAPIAAPKSAIITNNDSNGLGSQLNASLTIIFTPMNPKTAESP